MHKDAISSVNCVSISFHNFSLYHISFARANEESSSVLQLVEFSIFFLMLAVDCGLEKQKREKIIIASRLAVWQRCRWVDVASFEDNFQLVVVIFSSSAMISAALDLTSQTTFQYEAGRYHHLLYAAFCTYFPSKSRSWNLSYGCFIFLYYFIFDTNHTLDRVSAITHYITSFISQVIFFLFFYHKLHALHNRRRERHFQANFSRKSAIRDSKQPTESVIISISQPLLSQAKRQQATSGVEMNWQSIISLIDNGRIISSLESICRGPKQAAVSNSP